MSDARRSDARDGTPGQGTPGHGVFRYWPNRITALRLVGAAILFTALAVWGERPPEANRGVLGFCFWLFVVTCATDFLDGWLARRGNVVSAFGRVADPFVDKVLILGTMVFLAVLPWSRGWLPAWIVVVILAREFLVTGIRGYVESVGGSFPADTFGKVKMVVQCLAVGGIFWSRAWAWPAGWQGFWDGLVHVLVWVTLVATVASGASYVLKSRSALREARA